MNYCRMYHSLNVNKPKISSKYFWHRYTCEYLCCKYIEVKMLSNWISFILFFLLFCLCNILIKYKQLFDSHKTRSNHELLSMCNDINATSAAHITMGTSKVNVSLLCPACIFLCLFCFGWLLPIFQRLSDVSFTYLLSLSFTDFLHLLVN